MTSHTKENQYNMYNTSTGVANQTKRAGILVEPLQQPIDVWQYILQQFR